MKNANDNLEKGNIYKPTFYENWEEKILYDLAVWKNGLAFKNINFTDSGRPVIKIAELKNGITSQTKFTKDIFDDSVHLTKGDMLFSWSGNPETSIDVFYYNLHDGWLNQHIFKITTKNDVFYKYFFYILKYLKPNFQAIATNKQTTGLGHVTINDLKKLKIKLPPLDEQKKIASILSSLDEKIELNKRMNKILEETAQIIFKEWFVNFNFPNKDGKPYKKSGGKMIKSEIGDIPEGWKIDILTNIASIQNGYGFKSSDYVENGVNMIRTTDIQNNYINNEDIIKVPIEFYHNIKYNNFKLENFDTLLVMVGASIGKVGLVIKKDLPALQNQNMWRFRIKSDYNISPLFIYFYVKRINSMVRNQSNGSAREFYRKCIFENAKIVLPDEKVINIFNDTMTNLFIKIGNNLNENQKLASIRDSILPKLMSGEIRIK